MLPYSYIYCSFSTMTSLLTIYLFHVQFYVFFSFKIFGLIFQCALFSYVLVCLSLYGGEIQCTRYCTCLVGGCTYRYYDVPGTYSLLTCTTVIPLFTNFTLETRFLFSPIKFKPCSNLLSPSLLSLALQPSLPFRLRQGAVRLFRIRMIIMIK